MAVSTPSMLETSFVVPQECFWRLSVAQYHAMIQAGIVTEDDPVELLDGWLVTKSAKNRPHSLTTQLTREALAALLPPGWYIDDEEPLTLVDSEPEPDLVVVRGTRRDYRERHPGPGDVALGKLSTWGKAMDAVFLGAQASRLLLERAGRLRSQEQATPKPTTA